MLNQVVHFVLKKKWFDMIASGEKTVEYRKFGGYWANRLYGKNIAVFHFGYTKKIMIFEIKRIKFSLKTSPEPDSDLKKTEWGFDPKEDLFLIVLGKRLPEGEGII